MSKNDFVAGLDMGSGRVTCLIGAPEPGSSRMRVLGGASVPCRGISGGGVVNIIETKCAVEDALGQAEQAAGVTVSGVCLGVRGTQIAAFNNRGALAIARSDREITPEDVASVIANAAAVPISPDREILHVVPQSFSLDRQRGVPDPVGMEGTFLEVDAHVVTASSSHISNLTKSVALAGFEVTDVVYGLLATGEQLVSPEEKDLGALLLDLGGQSLSLGIYSHGAIRYSKELGLGADFITRDLAVGLRTSIATAERLKIAHGLAACGGADEDREVEFHRFDGRTLDKVKTSELMKYIVPRVEEIFGVVADDVQSSSCADLIGGGGLVLTGGGSLMQGLAAAAQELMGLETRVGLAHPERVGGEERWLGPVYATALGLLTPAAPAHRGRGLARLSGSKTPPWLRRVLGLLNGLL
jgi:cell division protein FtsA